MVRLWLVYVGYINQQSNHAIDPLVATFCFWVSLSEIAGTSQSPTTVPENLLSPPTNVMKNLTRNQAISPSQIYQPGKRPNRPDLNDLHPIPHLRECKKNTKFTSMNGESKESRIIRPKFSLLHKERPPQAS